MPPRPHNSEVPGAANSRSVNTSPTVEKEKALMLKSPPMKSTLCWTMWACKRRRREVEASLFLATTLWTRTEQNVTFGVPERDGRRSSPRTTSADILHVSLVEEASEVEKTAASGSNVSLLSKMARSVPLVYAMNWSRTRGA